jgi:ABC-2 type transport system ATP-binding protein
MAGRVWHRTVPKAELEACKARLQVISTRLRGGQTLIHVLSDDRPEPGFEPVAPSLEDLYFATLVQHRRDAVAA